ncbi:hypothetical protein M0D69_14030 [Caballeronia sp. SEWSISQ10-4 2]|uniref:hypothetical protein n=1 Tax=Caballeronia sp. SEWSISQ10-4 2 TaxID=2937438 RepID=UPI00264FCB7D|nr:hypothetical protein [Caballeronia sp. SEWSISQ10-4 2]MDN7179113.1 hypothetical protein [Caballeronia sp. SEWSISQ10-4 2]
MKRKYQTRKGDDVRLSVWRSRHVCYGKGGGGSAPAPDPAVGQAALENIQLGKDWLSFAQDQFAQGNVRQADLDALTSEVTKQQMAQAQQQMATQTQQNQWAQEDRDRYKNTFQPLQDDYIKQAKEYGSVEKQESLAAEAVADAQQGARAANDANNRSMASMGINPNSGRFEGITRGQEVLNSLNQAGAANNARSAARDKALALQSDAINLGNGLPSSAASSIGLGMGAGMNGVGAGSSAVGNNQAANQNFYANQGIMGQGFGGAMNGNNSGAGIFNSQYQSQVGAYNAQQQASGASSGALMGGIGSLAGAGIMAF